MAIIKSKQVWLHPVNITEDIDFALISAAPTINVMGVVSTALKPRKLDAVNLCISTKEAAAIEKNKLALSKAKASLSKARKEIKDLENALQKLKRESHDARMHAYDLESENRTLQYNLEVLDQNINNKELMLSSARNEGHSPPKGLGKLSDFGAVGKPLQGGLPSLGKKK